MNIVDWKALRLRLVVPHVFIPLFSKCLTIQSWAHFLCTFNYKVTLKNTLIKVFTVAQSSFHCSWLLNVECLCWCFPPRHFITMCLFSLLSRCCHMIRHEKAFTRLRRLHCIWPTDTENIHINIHRNIGYCYTHTNTRIYTNQMGASLCVPPVKHWAAVSNHHAGWWLPVLNLQRSNGLQHRHNRNRTLVFRKIKSRSEIKKLCIWFVTLEYEESWWYCDKNLWWT